jgi:hypothetical protein
LLDKDQFAQRCLLRALRPCHSLTELSLTMRASSRFHLGPLLELPRLHTLTLEIANTNEFGGRFDEEQMRVVKQLPNLRRLTLRECGAERDYSGTRWLRWLCPLPHRLQQLQEIDLSQRRLQLEHVEMLQRLPALTALEPRSVCATAMPLLPAFANRLQRLKLRVEIFNEEIQLNPELFDANTATVRASFFLAHLTPCTALTHLTLQGCVFSEAEAETLCRALAQLRDLDLNDVSWPSFESLRHLPLLESFSLRWTRGGPMHIDRAHIRPLQQLRRLTLVGVLPVDDDEYEDIIDALRPPSALLPGLVEFHFSP